MFIVCGEALFDVFATGNTPTGIAFDGRIGGTDSNCGRTQHRRDDQQGNGSGGFQLKVPHSLAGSPFLSSVETG